MKTLFSVKLSVVLIIILAFIAIGIEQCQAQNLDTTYSLMKFSLNDPDNDGKNDIVLLSFSNRDDMKITKVLVYFAHNGAYLGRVELESGYWIFYDRQNVKTNLGKDTEKPPWLKGV